MPYVIRRVDGKPTNLSKVLLVQEEIARLRGDGHVYEVQNTTTRAVVTIGKSRNAIGKSITIDGHDGARDTYSVLRVLRTKQDATGPLPSSLLRLIRAGGGAALIELNPSRKLRADGDMMVGAGISRPRYYFLALSPDGSRDGYPVGLKKSQVDRIDKYKA